MATIRGTGTLKRQGAKNFITEQARARMQEAIRPAQQQGMNALGVDYFDFLYYKRVDSSQLCTCKTVEVPGHVHKQSTAEPTISSPEEVRPDVVTIDHSRPLFYTANKGAIAQAEDVAPVGDSQEEYSELGLDEDAVSRNNLFGSGVNCGLCYGCGFFPGYELYGHQRTVFCNFNLDDAYGYNLDWTSAPLKFNLVDEQEGFAQFVVDVPKYFKAVKFSIRDNVQVLDEPLYDVTGNVVRKQHFQLNAGRSLQVRVRAQSFTHLVVEFDLGIELKANLSQANRATEWAVFNTLSNINIILPTFIPEVRVADIIYVPGRSTSFKVTEVQYLRPSFAGNPDLPPVGDNLDWSVGCRVVQPQESLLNIHKSQVLA